MPDTKLKKYVIGLQHSNRIIDNYIQLMQLFVGIGCF